jgi:hypothetical protein
MCVGLHESARYFCRILRRSGLCPQILVKVSNNKTFKKKWSLSTCKMRRLSKTWRRLQANATKSCTYYYTQPRMRMEHQIRLSTAMYQNQTVSVRSHQTFMGEILAINLQKKMRGGTVLLQK